jgi:hypothetical protein
MRSRVAVAALLIGAGSVGTFAGAGAKAAALNADAERPLVLAQANVPPTGMGDADMAMAAANMAEEERMKRRYPQPIRVGALIGARVTDNDSRTIGFISKVVRTPQDKIDVVVDCCGWFGFGGRPVAVPIAVLGVYGREVASLDKPRGDYASAPTWQKAAGETVLAGDDMVRIALARR